MSVLQMCLLDTNAGFTWAALVNYQMVSYHAVLYSPLKLLPI